MHRRFLLWSSAAFLPVVYALAIADHPLALVYFASFLVTSAYHHSNESRWRTLDHFLAWAVIASNCYLAVRSAHPGWTLAGVALVLAALPFYRGARIGRYNLRHGWWHLLSGAACWCFARGMLG